jgi:hypothetical protein
MALPERQHCLPERSVAGAGRRSPPVAVASMIAENVLTYDFLVDINRQRKAESDA